MPANCADGCALAGFNLDNACEEAFNGVEFYVQ